MTTGYRIPFIAGVLENDVAAIGAHKVLRHQNSVLRICDNFSSILMSFSMEALTVFIGKLGQGAALAILDVTINT